MLGGQGKMDCSVFCSQLYIWVVVKIPKIGARSLEGLWQLLICYVYSMFTIVVTSLVLRELGVSQHDVRRSLKLV